MIYVLVFGFIISCVIVSVIFANKTEIGIKGRLYDTIKSILYLVIGVIVFLISVYSLDTLNEICICAIISLIFIAMFLNELIYIIVESVCGITTTHLVNCEYRDSGNNVRNLYLMLYGTSTDDKQNMFRFSHGDMKMLLDYKEKGIRNYIIKYYRLTGRVEEIVPNEAKS